MPLNINASENTIKEIFSSSIYIIPDYQRPYSWDNKRCGQLWEDIFDIDSDNSSASYFLGSIIVTAEENCALDIKLIGKENRFYVIDGQQRLTTISILLSALYKSVTNRSLKDSIYVISDSDETKKLSPRVISCVNHYSEAIFFTKYLENTDFNASLPKDTSFKNNNNYEENFNYFREKIDELSDDEKNNMTEVLLRKLTLLKIVVPKREDALLIFKTINDRGMQLNDSDILKADIYNIASSETNEFIDKWEDLYQRVSTLNENERIKNLDMPFLFRFYMHIKRGINKETYKEISLLDFFKGKTPPKSKKTYIEKNDVSKIPWRNTIDDLDKLCGVLEWLSSQKEKYPMGLLYYAIISYNNLYPLYSIVVYLFHRVIKSKDDIWYLEKKLESDFIIYSEKILSLAYTIVLLKPGANAIKEVIYKIIVAASDKNNEILLKNYMSCDSKDFKKLGELLKSPSPKTVKGYLILLVYLNKNNKKIKNIAIPELAKLQTEHILPQKWKNNCSSQWSLEDASKVKDKLGNLILLDSTTNIRAGDSWFGAKKQKYETSEFKHGELLDLLDLPDDTIWDYDKFYDRDKISIKKLLDFFKKSFK